MTFSPYPANLRDSRLSPPATQLSIRPEIPLSAPDGAAGWGRGPYWAAGGSARNVAFPERARWLCARTSRAYRKVPPYRGAKPAEPPIVRPSGVATGIFCPGEYNSNTNGAYPPVPTTLKLWGYYVGLWRERFRQKLGAQLRPTENHVSKWGFSVGYSSRKGGFPAGRPV